MYLAFEDGLEPTLGALLHSLSPVLTVLLAGVLLGERVGWLQASVFFLMPPVTALMAYVCFGDTLSLREVPS